MVLGLLDQLQIFLQLYLVELLVLLTGLGLCELYHLIYPRSLTFDRVWHVGCLHKLKSYGSSVQIFGLFLLFSVIESLEWLWMGIFHKNIQLMLKFPKAPLLVLHFSYYNYTLLTFLTMFYVILLSMLMILLSLLSVIRHMICGINFNWLLNLSLINDKLWTGAGIGLLISML